MKRVKETVRCGGSHYLDKSGKKISPPEKQEKKTSPKKAAVADDK